MGKSPSYIFSFSLIIITIFGCSAPIKLIEYQNIATFNQLTKPDSSSYYFIKPYSDSLNAILNVQIAHTDSNLLTIRANKTTPKNKIEKMGNLGRIAADYLLKEGSNYSLNNLGFPCHFAIINHGGIRSSISKGPITLKSMFEIMPFENEMVLIELNGRQMDSLLNYLVSKNIAAVSGIEIHALKNTYGKVDIAGLAFDSRRNYWVVANDFIQKGGDFFTMLKYPKQVIHTGIKLRDLLEKGFKSEFTETNKINPRLQPRIFFND